MNVVDAFLYVTAFSYMVYALMGQTIKGWTPLRCSLSTLLCFCLLSGALILECFVDTSLLWQVYGLIWAAASAASYFHVVKWNLKDTDEVSHPHQVFMAGWDLLIAIACLMKV